MTRLLWLCGVAVLLTAGAAGADDKKDSDAFEAMRKSATPGPFHKKLEPLVGSWTWTSKFWFDPSKSPKEGTGTSERKWILGNRFVAEDVASKEVFGGPFQGFGLMGYDNIQKKYVTVWTDSLTTAISNSIGTVDESGKLFTFHNEVSDPLSGQKIKGRDVVKIIDDNKHTMEMYKVGPDGKEVKAMEITFTRKK